MKDGVCRDTSAHVLMVVTSQQVTFEFCKRLTLDAAATATLKEAAIQSLVLAHSSVGRTRTAAFFGSKFPSTKWLQCGSIVLQLPVDRSVASDVVAREA